MVFRMIWEQSVIIIVMMAMVKTERFVVTSPHTLLYTSKDCPGRMKLDCTRLVFNKFDHSLSKSPVCCFSNARAEERVRKICDRCINLSNTSLVNLKYDAFKIWPNIEYVDMSRNSFKMVHRSLFDKSVELSYLNLSHNNLEELELKMFSEITKLSILDLSYNSLNNVTEGTFFSTTNLSNLNLSHNNLIDLENKIFSKTTQLSNLDLSYNYLTKLENIFSTTSNLYNLNLCHNNLHVLDNTIFSKTTQLSFLDLSYNTLESIDNFTFLTTAKLYNLNLSNNILKDIHNGTFCKTIKLFQLDISNNNLKKLEANTFLKLTELHYLNLSHNFLDKLDIQTFHTTVQLSYLDLSHNQLQHIHEKLFLTLYKLKYLDLKNNKLATLSNELLFSSQKNLIILNLANNSLTDITVGVLLPLDSIEYFYLSENPFNCDCDLYNIRMWCINHTLDTNATCVDSMLNTTEPWTEINIFPKCEKNETSERSENPPATISIIAGSIFLGLVVGCVLTLVSIFYCRRFKKTSNDGREAILDTVYNNMSENYYYASVTVPEENVTSFCTEPNLPDRPSTEQADKMPHNYEYLESPHTMDPSKREYVRNNFKQRLSTNSGKHLPKEINVVNDLYK